MPHPKSDYDPIGVEKAIDEAYGLAEELDEDYRDDVLESIEEFEEMPYTVNRDENYTAELLTEATNALDNIDHACRENAIEAREMGSEDISRIDEIVLKLTKRALVPARRHGDLLTTPDEAFEPGFMSNTYE